MSVNDDAEDYAVSVIRACVDETEDAPASRAIVATYNEVAERLEAPGVASFVAALGRFAAVAVEVAAHEQGRDVHNLLDEFTMHKRAQQTGEEER